MVKAFRVLIAGVASVSAFAVMAAAPAQADEATYLRHLAPKYSFLSPQMYFGVLAITTIGLLSNYGLEAVESRLTRWRSPI